MFLGLDQRLNRNIFVSMVSFYLTPEAFPELTDSFLFPLLFSFLDYYFPTQSNKAPLSFHLKRCWHCKQFYLNIF